MTDTSSFATSRRRHRWRRDLVELAALFTAVAVADAVANTVAHTSQGSVALVGFAVVLFATTAFHLWWAHRHEHAPPGNGDGPSAGASAPAARAAEGATSLWRMRTTVRDEPGSLARLCTALARCGADIVNLQTHPLAHGTVDELLLRTPAALEPGDLSRAVGEAGAHSTWIERADAHDLVDVPARVLGLATRTALDSAEIPLALRKLLGRCTVHSLPSGTGGMSPPAEGLLEETQMQLPDPSGGTLLIERPHLPFTPAEFARARALVELGARLGPRLPRGRDVPARSEGDDVTVRRADAGDLPAARAMHERCSPATLRLRYHGPVDGCARHLDHLLSPRFGRTLAAQTGSGRIVALGHLLWDGDESEVALLVEDDWQGRGIGAELLRRLVALAVESGCERVYAVTREQNTAIVATMRGLGVPLDYQLEDGTVVITARPDPAPTRP
ncbi:GNAT family N-acetyltransferase [Streptomyces meridianus]|uniref:GNAT family N-acetyltransferase n=1 Tax=Streptomyces meridianus TaxID=2938945 RepID=A0ABT0X4B8_9ACTN|nr:GNAT family N-acetyltransferase [Streptomyces meridianus]MCM2577377.1 GNAT family N-acetyltransferase [Streptomyces meridianus]